MAGVRRSSTAVVDFPRAPPVKQPWVKFADHLQPGPFEMSSSIADLNVKEGVYQVDL
jgi:hypothetical protein